MVAAPAFIWMGLVLFHSRFGEDMFEMVHKWLGQLPAGLAIAATWACALFGTISGSSIAAAVTIGSISIPEMRKRGYSDDISTGIVASAGTLASLIPPSITMILYAVVADVSTGKLFFAGFIPGAGLAMLFSLYVVMRGVLNPEVAPRGPIYPWRARFVSLYRLLPVVLLFMGVFGGIYTGVFSPTEAGALGCLMAIIISLVYRRLTLRIFWDSAKEALRVSSMIYMIVVGAIILTYFFLISGVPPMIERMVLGWEFPPFLTLLVMMFVLMIAGMFLPTTSLLYLFVPVFLPIVLALGIDPILFGIFMVFSSEMASITPPVGLNLFAIAGISNVSITRIALGSAPYVFLIWLMFILLYFFPAIALWLPSTMTGK